MSSHYSPGNFNHSPVSHENGLNPELLREASISAVVASMGAIKKGQDHIEEVLAQGVVEKADATFKTVTDELSGLAAISELQARFPDIPIISEDSGSYGVMTEEQQRGFMVDGLDGTSDFLKGKDTSTAITTQYNRETRQIEQVTIGRPSTGEVWYTHEGKTLATIIDPETGMVSGEGVEVSVSPEALSPDTSVLIEKLDGFKRDEGTRQILTDENVTALVEGINQKGHVRKQGSNGLNLAQVASGQDSVVASVTTAMGGQWDVSGALAVVNAGGVAEGYRLNDDRTLTPADALDPFEYDILIAANTAETLEYLRDCLHRALEA